MSESHQLKGRCLCGAVTVSATAEAPVLRACHCDMCRQHTSGMFISVAIDEGSLDVSGPAQSFRSSEWAERGFCSTCGSTLWYGTVHDGARHPAAGLFEDLKGAPMKIEFFADMCPSGYALGGDHRKLTTEETLALFAPNEGETS